MTAKVGAALRFDASGSSSAGQLTYYLWDFDDGSNATGRIVDHMYMQVGSYNVTLLVRDDLGKTDIDHLKVTVVEEVVEEEPPEVKEEGIGPMMIIVALVALVLVILAVVALLMLRKNKEVSSVALPTGQVPPGTVPSTYDQTPKPPEAQGQVSDIDFLFAPRQQLAPGQPPAAPLPVGPTIIQPQGPISPVVVPTEAVQGSQPMDIPPQDGVRAPVEPPKE